MLELEMLAKAEQQYREEFVYPRAERNARHLRDLELEDQAHGRARRGPRPVCWLGRALVGAGAMLVALGERLAPRSSGFSNPQS